MKTRPAAGQDRAESLLADIGEGLCAVRGDAVLRILMLNFGAITLFAGMMNVAEVLLVEGTLHAGGPGFAALVAVFGVGTVAGSLLSAHARAPQRLRLCYLGGLAVMGLSLLGSAQAPSVAVAMVTCFLTGVSSAVSVTLDRALVQQLVPERMLARTFGLVSAIESWGLGAALVLAGGLADAWGARGVFAVSGAGTLVVTALAARTILRVPWWDPLPAPAAA